jgi:hypothetical protein
MEGALCIVSARQAWIFLAAWGVVVLVHALWRSVGSAPQDPIRPSGPGV